MNDREVSEIDDIYTSSVSFVLILSILTNGKSRQKTIHCESSGNKYQRWSFLDRRAYFWTSLREETMHYLKSNNIILTGIIVQSIVHNLPAKLALQNVFQPALLVFEATIP
jgi:hypothetical protein